MKYNTGLFWAAFLVSSSFLLLFYCFKTHGKKSTTEIWARNIGPEGELVERRTNEGTSYGVDPDDNEERAPVNWRPRTTEVVTTEKEEPCSAGYVFADGLHDAFRRFGNHFYDLAAGYCVARMTGRCLAINDSGDVSEIEKVFLFGDYVLHKVAPGSGLEDEFQEENHLLYDKEIERLRFVSPGKAVVLRGYFQSFKYFEDGLENMFRFRPEIKNLADRFLDESTPAMWKGKRFIRVGMHVRRGDYLNPESIEYGFTIPDESYYRKSVQYMVDEFRPYPIQIIVASEDTDWVERNIRADMFNGSVEIAISKNHSAGEDLAILASCEHLIQSTGTFGHFAAWLLTWNRRARGNTTIIYYTNFPRNGSKLYSRCRKEDYFHPDWVGME